MVGSRSCLPQRMTGGEGSDLTTASSMKVLQAPGRGTAGGRQEPAAESGGRPSGRVALAVVA